MDNISVGQIKTAGQLWREKNPDRVRASKVKWASANPDKIREKNARWYAANHEKSRAKTNRWRAANPDKVQAMILRSKYGLTTSKYEEMNVAQDGVCAVCGNTNAGGNRLCVDHDHRSGSVRGLLCRSCNLSIGNANDDPELLRKLALYLEDNKKGEKNG